MGLGGLVVLAVLWACVCVFLGAAGVAACIALAGIVSSEACTRLVAWARAKPGPGLQRAPHAQPASEAPIVDELEARRSARGSRHGGGGYVIDMPNEKGTP